MAPYLFDRSFLAQRHWLETLLAFDGDVIKYHALPQAVAVWTPLANNHGVSAARLDRLSYYFPSINFRSGRSVSCSSGFMIARHFAFSLNKKGRIGADW